MGRSVVRYWIAAASGETVIFDGHAQGDVIGGLNQAAVDLAKLQIMSDHFGAIGKVGDPLIISADLVVNAGGGRLVYQDGTGTTDVFIVQSSDRRVEAWLSGNTFTRLRVNRGHVVLNPAIAGYIISRLGIAYVNCLDADAYVGMGALSYVVSNFYQMGGLCEAECSFVDNGVVVIVAGRLRVHGVAASAPTNTTLAGGTIECWGKSPPAVNLSGRERFS